MTTEAMKAVVLEQTGSAENLVYQDTARPLITDPNHVLIRVKACGVAYRDIIERRGGHPFLQTPIIQGHEFSGEVVETGANVRRWTVGDRVINLYVDSCGVCDHCVGGDERRCANVTQMFGLITNGGYAEYVVAHERALERLHDDIPYEIGACIMSAVAVAYNNVNFRVNVRKGEIVLVTGASGGVGMAALQCIKCLGATAWAVTSNADKVSVLEEMGADRVFVNDGSSIHKEVRALEPAGIDAAIDCVGSATLLSAIKSLRRMGRVAAIGTINPEPLNLNLGTIVVNGIEIKGSDGTSRVAIRESMELVASGAIRVRIDQTLPLAEAANAHQRLEDRKATGRIVLVP